MQRALLLLCLFVPACDKTPVINVEEPSPKPGGDPAIKYYKGPADGKKISIHLQDGFDGQHVTLHYNDHRLYDSAPKTKNTLGLAEIVNFTIGAEPKGKIGIQGDGQVVWKTFTWENGTHIGVRIRVEDEKKVVRWEQSKEAFQYD